MKPVVGITTRRAVDGPLPYDGAAVSYVDAVRAAGGLPVLLPNVPDSDVLAALDGLLLSGGGDFAPALFGQEDAGTNWQGQSDDRDASELALLRGLGDRPVPTLGICRGMQAFAVAFGGTLIQDIAMDRPEALAHSQAAGREAATHAVEVSRASWLATVVGSERLGVNSFHHQAVDRVPQGFRAVAWAPDGIIEAIESVDPGRFCLGVQWHPEHLFRLDPRAMRIFTAFVARAAAERRRVDSVG